MREPGNELRVCYNHQDEGGDHVKVYFSDNKSLETQFRFFMDALKVYDQRNAEYKDNWKRMGWRGMLIRVRERAERLWDALWDARAWDDIEGEEAEWQALQKKLDDAVDLANFCGFLSRAVADGNRDGSWWS